MKQIYLLLMTLLLVHVQVFGQSVPSYVPTNGLVGWWGFNGNAQDGSGNGNHGTVNGATLTTDRFGNQNGAYSFDGVDDFISVSECVQIPLSSNNRTCSFWIKSNIIDNPPNRDILNWGNYQSNQRFGFTMYSGLTYFCAQNNDFYGSVFVGDNGWKFITLTYNGQFVSIYVNGLLDGGQFRNLNTVGDTIVIGSSPLFHPDATYFDGLIDDIGIWNRALSQQEITNLYNSQSCQVSITTQPSSQTTGTNRNVQFSVISSDSNSTYRWQTDMGLGFQNLTNAGQYLGVNTSTLNVSNTSPHNDNQLFRCIVSTTYCGSDTSDVVTLNVNSSSSSTGVPNKFTYQSVVRDTSGQLVTNQSVGMRLSLQRGPHLANLYTETHQLTTNSNGLLTCIIGSGQPTLGMMDTIDWSEGMVYVKTEIDMSGGSNYSLVSTRELLSVPYALYSLNSGSSTPGPVGPMGPQGVPGPQGPSGVSFPSGGISGQALYYCNGVPTWGPCPNQPTMPTVTTNLVTLLPGNSASTGGNVTSDGGSPVTHRGVVYDTTSNPSLTSNYSVDGSGTGSFVSTLNNLAPTTTYYTRAYATNAVGTAYGSVVSFSTNLSLPTVTIGQNHAGGIVFYVDSTGQHGLACTSFDQNTSVWGCNGTYISGTSTTFGTGMANTTAIVNGCSVSPFAASECNDLVLNGYNDWYLPSRDELVLMYQNLKTQSLGNFSNDWYWSSSQVSSGNAWYVTFHNGMAWHVNIGKYDYGQVRAVRAF
ncbi:MAG: DUF1566 domain-containing protein [Bacteroidetes bacterium]|jgi:hypothetical protein|nr:DUF1566 domain-containing protein [Bacteroidota bacterium]